MKLYYVNAADMETGEDLDLLAWGESLERAREYWAAFYERFDGADVISAVLEVNLAPKEGPAEFV